MSKKIIYLLSLLMALSLVFASCKNNSPTDSLGNLTPPPTENEDNIGDLAGDNGLANVEDSTQLDSTKPLTIYKVFEPNGVDYFRTPVVQVMGTASNVVAVFGEKRYKSQGAVNDVGIDGEHAVDVIYSVSINAGTRFNGVEIVGGKQANNASESRGAPVVFKIDQKTVVIVANSGVGIARTTADIVKNNPSKLEYIVGTLAEDTGKFTWGSWQLLQVNGKSLLDIISTIDVPNTFGTGIKYEQMGTHSGKGQVVSDNTLILPVVMAQQGTSEKGKEKEIMGVYFLKGTFSGSGAGASVSWENLEGGTDTPTENKTYFRFGKGRNGTSSYYKETIVINATDTQTFQYIAIPSGGSKYGLGNVVKTTNISKPNEGQITGWFGSPDYLTLKWHGSEKYNPKKYDNSAQNQSLFIGSKVDAPNGQVTLYKVEKGTLTINGKAAGYMFNPTSKSGSLDVLGDGTIITVSEDGATREWDYVTVLRRHSQKYLASLLDNN